MAKAMLDDFERQMDLEFSSSRMQRPDPPKLPKLKDLSEDDFQLNYYENMVGTKALIYLMPAVERKNLVKWVNLLEGMGTSAANRKKRNLFTWYMFEQLKNGKISSPFNKEPSETELPDEHMLPQAVFYEFRQVVETEKEEAEEMRKRDFHTTIKKKSATVRPSRFIDRQPCPKSGFTAYGACFSNQYK
jgi:hypothetical protein